MIFNETALPGAYLVDLNGFKDDRGEFARAFCRDEFEAQGLVSDFVQGNVSLNPHRGTLRGMHYQLGEHAEVKLVRCVRGAIFDVIIDLRPQSPTYRKWIGVELSPKKLQMLYVPVDFAHGFQTLEDDTEVNYLVSAAYAPKAARGVRYDDPAFGIRWPVPVTKISPQDSSWPLVPAEPKESAASIGWPHLAGQMQFQL
jgi:dTDP-4-dehydrorhamnose 3,5-epimerase